MCSRYLFAPKSIFLVSEAIHLNAPTLNLAPNDLSITCSNDMNMVIDNDYVLTAGTITQTSVSTMVQNAVTMDVNISGNSTFDAVGITQTASGAFIQGGSTITQTATTSLGLNGGTTVTVTAQDLNSFTINGNRILNSNDLLDTALLLLSNTTNTGGPITKNVSLPMDWVDIPVNTFFSRSTPSQFTLLREGIYTFGIQFATPISQSTWNLTMAVNGSPVDSVQWRTPLTQLVGIPMAHKATFQVSKVDPTAFVVDFALIGDTDAPGDSLGCGVNMRMSCVATDTS
jgi:hypothetical protein